MHLEVADTELCGLPNGKMCQSESQFVGEKAVVALLEWIERGDEKPQFVNIALLA